MPEPRMLSETEVDAIVADRVTRETASLTSEIENLKTEKAALAADLDVAQANLTTVTSDKETVEREFADYKDGIEQEREIAARTDDRVAKVKSAAPALPEEYFTPERAARWAAMEEAAFEGLVADLAPAAPQTDGREVASLQGKPGTPPPAGETVETGNGVKLFAVGRG